MRSHGLRQVVDDKSVASCEQTCCKLIVKTYKLFQQVITSLQMTSRNKPDFKQTGCNLKFIGFLELFDTLVKLTTCKKSGSKKVRRTHMHWILSLASPLNRAW